MLIFVGTATNHSQVDVTPTSVKVSELGLSGDITLNGVKLLNIGQTVQDAITATGAVAPYYFLSVRKQQGA